MKALVILAMAACGPRATIAPGPEQPLRAHAERMIDTSPKERRRMVPPEVYLRAYLTWFGGLAPLDAQARARPRGMFDAWDDYLAALGLPDDRLDLPRATQSNTLMAATLGRLGEALCVRAAEHDLHGGKVPVGERVVFAFADIAGDASLAEFSVGLDALHRLFLGYPLRLAPADRAGVFYGLYTRVVARHAAKQPLTPAELGWVAVCSALVQHPEAELY